MLVYVSRISPFTPKNTSHTQAGVIETVFCLAAYFFVLLNNGLRLADVTHPERVSPKLAAMAATAYYVTLILSQVRPSVVSGDLGLWGLDIRKHVCVA